MNDHEIVIVERGERTLGLRRVVVVGAVGDTRDVEPVDSRKHGQAVEQVDARCHRSARPPKLREGRHPSGAAPGQNGHTSVTASGPPSALQRLTPLFSRIGPRPLHVLEHYLCTGPARQVVGDLTVRDVVRRREVGLESSGWPLTTRMWR